MCYPMILKQGTKEKEKEKNMIREQVAFSIHFLMFTCSSIESWRSSEIT